MQLFKPVNSTVDEKTHNRLQRIADERKASIASLIAIAIHNELECENPFELDCSLDSHYIEDSDLTGLEALSSKLVEQKDKLSMPYLLLAHRAFGCSTIEYMKRLLTELKDQGVIKEVKSRKEMKNGAFINRVNIKVMNSKYHGKAFLTREQMDLPPLEDMVMQDYDGHTWYLYQEEGRECVLKSPNIPGMYPCKYIRKNILKELYKFKWDSKTGTWRKPIDKEPFIYDEHRRLFPTFISQIWWVDNMNKGDKTFDEYKKERDNE